MKGGGEIRFMILVLSIGGFVLLLLDEYLSFYIRRLTLQHRRDRPTRKVKAGCVEYYRIYKSIYMQQSVGISPFEIMKRLYMMTEHKGFQRVLREMAELISNSNSIEKGIAFLKWSLVDEDSILFLNVLENSARAGFSAHAMRQMDHLFFQKYLIDIKRQVKRTKRRYFQAALLFCSAVFLAIFMPVVDQMLRSLGSIFSGF